MTTKNPSSSEEETNVVETLQSLIVAFALAMSVRSFVTEGFVIPTGSMAPTLMGEHVRLTSPATGYTFPADAGRGSTYQRLEGPYLQWLNRPTSRRGDPPPAIELLDPMVSLDRSKAVENRSVPELVEDRRMGDRVLVLKYLYAFQDPQRWDVVVFKNPTDPNGDAANYIKRLVGLPNEQLLVLDGDIFTAPLGADRSAFRIQRKPEHVQRAVWQEVQNSDYMPVDPAALGKRWGRAWPGTPWEATGFDLGARGNARSWRHDGAGPARLSWRNDVMQIVDFAPYNLWSGISSDRYSVSDVRVSMAIDASDPQKLAAKYTLRTRGRNLVFAIDGTKASLRVERASETSGDQGVLLSEASEEFEVPGPGAPFDVEFWHVDQQLSMWVNDRKVVELDYAFDSLEDRLASSYNGHVPEDLAREPRRSAPPPQLDLEFSGSSLTLHRVRVDRDLYYRPEKLREDDASQFDENGPAISGIAFGTNFQAPAQLLADQFMMCGDNSAASKDSRLWGRPSPLVEAVFGKDQGFDAPFVVPRALLLGKAWCVYFPAPVRPMNGLPKIMPDFGELRFIR